MGGTHNEGCFYLGADSLLIVQLSLIDASMFDTSFPKTPNTKPGNQTRSFLSWVASYRVENTTQADYYPYLFPEELIASKETECVSELVCLSYRRENRFGGAVAMFRSMQFSSKIMHFFQHAHGYAIMSNVSSDIIGVDTK